MVLILLQFLDVHDISLKEIDVTNKVDELIVSSHGEIVDEGVELAHLLLDTLDSLFEDLVEVSLILRHLDFLLLGGDVVCSGHVTHTCTLSSAICSRLSWNSSLTLSNLELIWIVLKLDSNGLIRTFLVDLIDMLGSILQKSLPNIFFVSIRAPLLDGGSNMRILRENLLKQELFSQRKCFNFLHNHEDKL